MRTNASVANQDPSIFSSDLCLLHHGNPNSECFVHQRIVYMLCFAFFYLSHDHAILAPHPLPTCTHTHHRDHHSNNNRQAKLLHIIRQNLVRNGMMPFIEYEAGSLLLARVSVEFWVIHAPFWSVSMIPFTKHGWLQANAASASQIY